MQLLAAGAGLAALLAGVALLSRGGSEERPFEVVQTHAGSKPKQGASFQGGSSGQAQAAGEQARAPRFDATVCWQDLERFNEGVTLANFREWAAPLLNSGDALVRDYLKGRLTELIGKEPAHALEVLEWARDAQGKSFGVFLMAVRDSDAVQQPQVATRLTDLGLDNSLPAEKRAALLSALDSQKRLAPAALERLANFAKDPVSGEAGWAAARTIGRVMKRESKANGNPAPYLDKLLTVGAESPDEQIRYLAQMMPMHSAPVLDAASTERYSKILVGEGNENGRDVAAHLLSMSEDKQKVLDLFAKTFPTEPSVCVRWALFRFAARTAGKAALPVMANMAATDPRFQPLYQQFEQIYASGTLDWVRLWNSLPDNDPFRCLDRHE